MKVSVESEHSGLRVLVVEPHEPVTRSPLLLFLHGRGEASAYSGGMALVLLHEPPPYQALLGRLPGVTVIAPQVVSDPNARWDWATYAAFLGEYLTSRAQGRPILATGFSRGGLGVLQLMRACPGLVQRWAVVDPAPPPDPNILASIPLEDRTGWLVYGIQMRAITMFSQQLAARLRQENIRPTQLNHVDVALRTYRGDRFGGAQSLYEFLGVKLLT
jgi:pimeloyl-ACP methyl ester carboxylesterase